MASGNSTIVCHHPHYFTTKRDLWHTGDPITSPASLFFLQTSLIALVSQFINFLLKPLGQSTIVSQILGGILFGPSVMGHHMELTNTLFPAKGTVVIDTIAAFGVMYFFFLMGVKMDPITLLRTEKKAITMGLSVFFFSLGLPVTLSLLLKKYVDMDYSLAKGLSYVAASQSFSASPVIASLLTELKILNSDVGRIALSASIVSDVVSIAVTAILFGVMGNNSGGFLSLLWILLSAVAVLCAILYIFRPTIIWMMKRSKDGNQVGEMHVVVIFTFVLISGFLSDIIGQHYVIGPFILGLAVPEGPPIGSTLIAKMQTLVVLLFYPTYLAVSGLQTNLFTVNFQSMWVVGVIVFFAFIVKIGAVMLPGFFSDIPMKECYVVGLILNAKGITELVVFNLWKGGKLLGDQEFTLVVMSVIVVTAVITPLIKYVYNPSEQYFTMKRSTIRHSKRDSELRIMVCVHDRENVCTVINLLEASCASIESPVQVIALILVELLGRARPLLMAHQPHDTLHRACPNSTQIDKALKQYELINEGCAIVQSFTSVSNFNTMDDDICRIALDRRANILIVPFHRLWEIDGGIETISRSIQGMNCRVLSKAPCSVGILIDRSILNSSLSLLTSKSVYHVIVIFIGGADDAEALAYGSRMARHERVQITVVRFLLFGEENSKDRKRDSDLIDEYCQANMRNPRFEIIVEVVRDGIEMSSCIKSLVDYFDLVMVGKDHTESTLLNGHEQWSECAELGVIGDMLASQDFGTKASVLVVQQQRLRGMAAPSHTINSKPNERHNVPDDRHSRDSLTISVDQ